MGDKKRRASRSGFAAFGLVVFALTALAACAGARHAASPTPSATPSVGSSAAASAASAAAPLRVGTSGDYPPFSVRASDGSSSGLDVDVATAYARDRGRTLELVPFAWPDLERGLAAGEFDVAMSGVTVRGDRLTTGTLSASVVRGAAVVVVPDADTRPFPADGDGRKVVVNRGGHLERVARARLPRATIVTVDDNRSLPAVLASGDVDGVVTDTLEHASFASHGAPASRVALVLSEDRKAYWVAPGNDALAADLDAWLAAREADGTLDRLRSRHLGAAAATARPELPPATAHVVDLIARRLMLMPQVAREKEIAGLPVEVPSREQQVYARARDEAARASLAPEPYVALVRAQIEAAKQVQRAVLAQSASGEARSAGANVPTNAVGGSAGAAAGNAAARGTDASADATEARQRIDTQLRPAIDALDRRLRAALAAAAPIEQTEPVLAAALRADAPVPGFGAAEADAIAAALRGVRRE